MSSSELTYSTPGPVTTLEYRNIEAFQPGVAADKFAPTAELQAVQISEEDLARRIAQAAAEARTEAEGRMRREFEARLSAERSLLTKAIEGFQQERAEYYARVESEVVQLALSIAAKILHREAQVDKMLLAALVRVAIENLQHRSNVIVRLRPEKCGAWRSYFAQHLKGTKVEILEDSQLSDNDCVLETELGTADVSLDAQVKEIERGFFDLLAQRPEIK